MWREPQAIHMRRKTADDAVAGTPTSGGVAQGHNIKAGSSRTWQSWTTQHALADVEGKTGFLPKQIVAGLAGDSVPGKGITWPVQPVSADEGGDHHGNGIRCPGMSDTRLLRDVAPDNWR